MGVNTSTLPAIYRLYTEAQETFRALQAMQTELIGSNAYQAALLLKQKVDEDIKKLQTVHDNSLTALRAQAIEDRRITPEFKHPNIEVSFIWCNSIDDEPSALAYLGVNYPDTVKKTISKEVFNQISPLISIEETWFTVYKEYIVTVKGLDVEG